MRVIDQLENGTDRAIQQAKRLKLRGYDQDELGEVARDAAAVWERMLKASNPGWTSNDTSLYEMTEALRLAGWPKAPAKLHHIRKSANRDKHSPDPLHDVDQLIGWLEVIKAELGSLAPYAPGVTLELPAQLRIRRMVCAVYEIFHQGETIYRFLEAGPADTWQTSGTIDEFQVENKHHEYIESELAKLPSWSTNPPELDDLKKSLEKSDDALWQIMHFDASYQQIHDILAPLQHDLPLLPGLHREDEALNFIASVAQAVLTGGHPDLLGRSPLDEATVRGRVEALITNVPERLKPMRLDRCSDSTFRAEAPAAHSIDEDLGALVTDRGVLLIRAR
jgi:hypothetical protein